VIQVLAELQVKLAVVQEVLAVMAQTALQVQVYMVPTHLPEIIEAYIHLVVVVVLKVLQLPAVVV
jgi:hypothetical protein